MSTTLNAVGTLELARSLLGALHRIRTSLETTKHLDIEEIAPVLIRCRNELRLAVELPDLPRRDETGISKPSMRIWVDQQLHLTMEIINGIEESAALLSGAISAADPKEIKALQAIGHAIETLLMCATFEPAVAVTVQ
ncbi:hypothetical protein HY633_04230 [Candidatus Uhrbacteria bacterium]|nr:hypothetical protein [Candidatus Uhrbacteria bacterium]